MTDLLLFGRSSSQYTRLARMVAIEAGVPVVLRPIFDLGSLDPASYGENPALKMPVLVDERGPLFGTENVCRELVRRSKRNDVVMRGEVGDRLVANAEELALHVMASDVAVVLARLGSERPPLKALRSIELCLDWLDARLDGLLATLPPRKTSFVEIALFCATTHLPFREVMDVARWTSLGRFCARFAERESASQTPYAFDRE